MYVEQYVSGSCQTLNSRYANTMNQMHPILVVWVDH